MSFSFVALRLYIQGIKLASSLLRRAFFCLKIAQNQLSTVKETQCYYTLIDFQIFHD